MRVTCELLDTRIYTKETQYSKTCLIQSALGRATLTVIDRWLDYGIPAISQPKFKTGCFNYFIEVAS